MSGGPPPGPPGGWGCWWGPGPHGRRRLRVDEEVAMLERHQRDLEEALADVVERLRRLRPLQEPEQPEPPAGEGGAPGEQQGAGEP